MNWVLLDFNKAAYRQGAHGQTPPPQKKPTKKPPKNQKNENFVFRGEGSKVYFR